MIQAIDVEEKNEFSFGEECRVVIAVSKKGRMFFEEGKVVVRREGKSDVCIRGVFVEWEFDKRDIFGEVEVGEELYLPNKCNVVILRKEYNRLVGSGRDKF